MAVASIERVEAAVGAETAFLPREDPEHTRPLSAALERHSWFNSGPDHIGKLETAIYLTGIASFALLRGLNLI